VGTRATKLRRASAADEIVAEIGVVSAIEASGELFVNLPSHGGPVRAFVLHGALAVASEAIGRSVLVFAVGGAIPVVVGLIDEVVEKPVVGARPEAQRVRDDVVVEAARSITLSCGNASIAALRSGKIVIRGTEITTCSSGTNKIKGATVKIN